LDDIMASLRGRYFSARDINFINSINAELMGDIIETLVTVFKIAASETKVNMYGESAPSEGKTFYPGIDISCFGWTRYQESQFYLQYSL